MGEDRLINLQMFAEGDSSGGGEAGGTPGEAGGTPGEAGTGGGEAKPAGGAPGAVTPPAEKMIPQSRVETIIQKRLAEEKSKYVNHDNYTKLIQKMETLTGLSHAQILQQLEQSDLESKAASSGLNPQTYQQLNSAQQAAIRAQMDNFDLRLDMEINTLKDHPYYSGLKDNQENLLAVKGYAKRFGTTARQAYWAIFGDKRAEALEKEVEQRVIADMEKKAAHGGVLGDSGGDDSSANIDPADLAMIRELKMDPQEFLDLTEAKDIDTYQKLKKKRAAGKKDEK